MALTLREVCGLTTEEIARAFLTSAPTLAQRIVRAKGKIRDERIPYEVPPREELPGRLDATLRVIYLVFNEGYSASSGESLTRRDLSEEAIRLGRLLVELLPDAEAVGLLALMLLHESRRDARATPQGEIILLGDQDRSRWNREEIAEGVALVERALYDVLARTDPSPVVELNRAVAVAMRDGPQAGLSMVEGILARGTWPSTTWPTRCGPTCAAGSGRGTMRGPPTSGRFPWPCRSPSGGFSSGASRSSEVPRADVDFGQPGRPRQASCPTGRP